MADVATRSEKSAEAVVAAGSGRRDGVLMVAWRCCSLLMWNKRSVPQTAQLTSFGFDRRRLRPPLSFAQLRFSRDPGILAKAGVG